MQAYRALTLASLAFAACSALADEGAFLLAPDIHGDRVVFTREGDLWLGDLGTGQARRLTRHAGIETRARFSPDGSKIAFQGQYDGGGSQVYVMPTEGGVPQRVTNRINAAFIEDWTPDGRKLLCRGPGPEFVWQPFLVPAGGGPEEPLPIERLGMGQIGTDGRLAFCRYPDVSGGAWFRYQGGARNDIWVGDLTTRSFRKIFESKTQAQFPQWIGDRVFFVHENDATWTVNSVSGNGGGAKRHTSPSSDVVYDLQSDGKRLIYVRGNGLEVFDPAANQALPVKLTLNSDRIHMREMRVDIGPGVESYSVTPTGKRILVESRGQIISVPAKEGEVRVWKAMPGVRLQKPEMSPDGKKVAYVSDETREQQVYVADADGSNAKAITKDSGRQIATLQWSPDSQWVAVGDSESRIRLVKADGSEDFEVARARRSMLPLAHRFSPDSKWLVYVEEKPWTWQQVNVISMIEIGTKTRHQVTSGRFRDDLPSFSSDGKYLVYASYRSLPFTADNILSQLNSAPAAMLVLVPLAKTTPSPFRPRNEEEGATPEKPSEDKTLKIDLDGIKDRLIMVPGVSGEISQVEMVGDRIVYVAGNSINFYDVTPRAGGTITPGGFFQVSADGKNLMVSGPRIVPIGGKDLPAAAGAVSYQGLKLDVDPAKEWEQIFWDAWRLCRDYFYVRNMHGVDWKAVGDRYAKLLPHVRARNELTELIRWMQAELSVGHSFRVDPQIFVAPPASTPAYLGVETKAEGGFHRITHFYDGDGMMAGSPLLEPGHGVGVGSYIVSVNGQPAPATMDWRELLRDRAGQIVSLGINTRASAEGAKTIYVRPHSAAVERSLWERDTVKKRRLVVDERSGGKVGYIYLGGMVDPDMEDFMLQYLGQLDKEALIVDIRENNGGYISAILVNLLRKETYLRRSERNSQEAGSRYHDAFEGHLCMLINEDSYSDGEGGPTNWRYAKLGPLIGKRTYGALVGSAPAWPLVDGGAIQVPRYGNYREDTGWVVEGTGVAPDIEVDNDPNLWAKGTDAQLERAIKEMMDRIAKKPIKRPVQPPDPTWGKTRGGGN
jgi:tricorn protease